MSRPHDPSAARTRTKELPVLALPLDTAVGSDLAEPTEELDPVEVTEALPSAAPAPPPGSSTADPRPSSPPRPRRRLAGAVLVASALAAVGAGGFAAGYRVNGAEVSRPAATGGAVAGSEQVAEVTVSSMDPVGGSGLRRTGSGPGAIWETQTYASEDFGNLKPGVGLVLDLGSARSLSSVEFDARTGPLRVELRAADRSPTTAQDGRPVGRAVTADGATTLVAGGGGEHRYWMVWVTRLAPSGGGYSAALTTPVANG